MESGKTAFRLTVTDVPGYRAEALELGLRSVACLEWDEFRYIPDYHLVIALGKMPCQAPASIKTYLGKVTHCAWDIVGEDLIAANSGRFPYVWLHTEPEEPGEKCYGFDHKDWSQYKRRRREFEAGGGNVLEQWGLTDTSLFGVRA